MTFADRSLVCFSSAEALGVEFSLEIEAKIPPFFNIRSLKEKKRDASGDINFAKYLPISEFFFTFDKFRLSCHHSSLTS